MSCLIVFRFRIRYTSYRKERQEEMKKTSGFTLIEVLIATMFLMVALLSTLGLLAHSLSLIEGNKSFLIAQYEAKRQMEGICANDYTYIKDTYTNAGALKQTPFTIAGLTGKGTVYANELAQAAEGLMRIKVVVCYQQRLRIIGEDSDLDGILGAGEDVNSNGELDSPCQIETVVVNMI